MESVRIEYLVEYLAGNCWKKIVRSYGDIGEAISKAEFMSSGRFDNVSSARIIEVRTITTERYMTLECAKNERSK